MARDLFADFPSDEEVFGKKQPEQELVEEVATRSDVNEVQEQIAQLQAATIDNEAKKQKADKDQKVERMRETEKAERIQMKQIQLLESLQQQLSELQNKQDNLETYQRETLLPTLETIKQNAEPSTIGKLLKGALTVGFLNRLRVFDAITGAAKEMIKPGSSSEPVHSGLRRTALQTISMAGKAVNLGTKIARVPIKMAKHFAGDRSMEGTFIGALDNTLGTIGNVGKGLDRVAKERIESSRVRYNDGSSFIGKVAGGAYDGIVGDGKFAESLIHGGSKDDLTYRAAKIITAPIQKAKDLTGKWASGELHTEQAQEAIKREMGEQYNSIKKAFADTLDKMFNNKSQDNSNPIDNFAERVKDKLKETGLNLETLNKIRDDIVSKINDITTKKTEKEYDTELYEREEEKRNKAKAEKAQKEQFEQDQEIQQEQLKELKDLKEQVEALSKAVKNIDGGGGLLEEIGAELAADSITGGKGKRKGKLGRLFGKAKATASRAFGAATKAPVVGQALAIGAGAAAGGYGLINGVFKPEEYGLGDGFLNRVKAGGWGMSKGLLGLASYLDPTGLFMDKSLTNRALDKMTEKENEGKAKLAEEKKIKQEIEQANKQSALVGKRQATLEKIKKDENLLKAFRDATQGANIDGINQVLDSYTKKFEKESATTPGIADNVILDGEAPTIMQRIFGTKKEEPKKTSIPKKAIEASGDFRGAIGKALSDANTTYKGMSYQFGGKSLNGSGVDCSGWIAASNLESMENITIDGKKIPKEQIEETKNKIFNGGAAGIIANVEKITGIKKQGAASDFAESDFEIGDTIGEDNGSKGWDKGRYNGIDHIVQIVPGPNGEKMVSESNSKDGVTLTSLSKYLQKKAKKGTKLFVVDLPSAITTVAKATKVSGNTKNIVADIKSLLNTSEDVYEKIPNGNTPIHKQNSTNSTEATETLNQITKLTNTINELKAQKEPNIPPIQNARGDTPQLGEQQLQTERFANTYQQYALASGLIAG